MTKRSSKAWRDPYTPFSTGESQVKRYIQV